MDERIKELVIERNESVKEKLAELEREIEELEREIEEAQKEDFAEREVLEKRQRETEEDVKAVEAMIWAEWLTQVETRKKAEFLYEKGKFLSWFSATRKLHPLAECLKYMPVLKQWRTFGRVDESSTWKDDWDRYSIAVSQDKKRENLTGMNIAFSKDGAEYASTDGRRLFCIRTAVEADELIVNSRMQRSGAYEIPHPDKTVRHGDIEFNDGDGGVNCTLKPLSPKVCEILALKCQEDINSFCESMKDNAFADEKYRQLMGVFPFKDLNDVREFQKSYTPIWHNGRIYAPIDGTYPDYRRIIPEYHGGGWGAIKNFERLVPALRRFVKIAEFEGLRGEGLEWHMKFDGGTQFSANAQYLLDGILSVGGNVTAYVNAKDYQLVLSNESDESDKAMFLLMLLKSKLEIHKEDEDALKGLLGFSNYISYRNDERKEKDVKKSVETRTEAERKPLIKLEEPTPEAPETAAVATVAEETGKKEEKKEETKMEKEETKMEKEETKMEKEETKMETKDIMNNPVIRTLLERSPELASVLLKNLKGGEPAREPVIEEKDSSVRLVADEKADDEKAETAPAKEDKPEAVAEDKQVKQEQEEKKMETQEQKVQEQEQKVETAEIVKKEKKKEVAISADPNSFTKEEMDALHEKKKGMKFYGDEYDEASKIAFINDLWKRGKFSLKIVPNKKEKGKSWFITCECLFDEVSFKYAKYLLNGGKMLA